MTTTEPSTQFDPVNVAVIIGSTRPGRRAPRIARWLTAQLATRDDIALDVIDLVDVELPAALPSDDHPAAVDLVDRIDRADAFIVVTPEYNHGYPASLKQAIDVPYREWNAKPVAFVSYGGMSGGIRAVEQLRQVFAELQAVTIRNGVAFPGTKVDEEGVAHDPDAAAAATAMLDELVWWALALRDARAVRPRGGFRPATGRPPATARAAAEVASILGTMADGFNARDVERADQHFSADAVLVAPDGRRVEGVDAIQVPVGGDARVAPSAGRLSTAVQTGDRERPALEPPDPAHQLLELSGGHWRLSPLQHNLYDQASDPPDDAGEVRPGRQVSERDAQGR